MANTVYCSREIAVRDNREFHADDAHELNRLISKFSREFSPIFVQEWHSAYQRYCTNGEDIIIVHHTRYP